MHSMLHADYARRVTVVPGQHQWLASPQDGVERMLLDRLGGERARATSLVRYAPGAHFPLHQHPGGEEILVLAGTLSEGGHDYPAGSYLRNPPGSAHQPFSLHGALLFVKLWQMAPGEQQALRIDTHGPSRWRRQRDHESCSLYTSDAEQVSLLRLDAGPICTLDGAELLVLDGALQMEGQHYPAGSWLRLPAGETASLTASTHGTRLYVKTGHLARLASAAAPC